MEYEVPLLTSKFTYKLKGHVTIVKVIIENKESCRRSSDMGGEN